MTKKNKGIARRAQRAALCFAPVAVLALTPGCGGGSPAANSSGTGRLQMNVEFAGDPAPRTGSSDAEVIRLQIVVQGVYEITGQPFQPIARNIEIDAAAGVARIAVLEIPIGRNHLVTARAFYPGGGSETVLGMVEEIKTDALASAEADPRTTPAVKAMRALAEREAKGLHELDYAQYESALVRADKLHEEGQAYQDMDPLDLID